MLIVYDSQSPEAIWKRRLVRKYYFLTTIELSLGHCATWSKGNLVGSGECPVLIGFFFSSWVLSQLRNKTRNKADEAPNITVIIKQDWVVGNNTEVKIQWASKLASSNEPVIHPVRQSQTGSFLPWGAKQNTCLLWAHSQEGGDQRVPNLFFPNLSNMSLHLEGNRGWESQELY